MWKKQIKLILLPIAGFMVLAFILFAVNQIVQVHYMASAINPFFGTVVLWTLSATFVLLLLIPVYLVLKLPKPLKFTEGNEELFRRKYFRRLKSNKFLKKHNFTLSSQADLEPAMRRLNQEADRITKKTASAVFLTTAISQNGKLDALTVFITQSQMVWKIAHLYYQRPGLRELVNLYANVGAATFFASQIEDLDISEQLEPVLKGFLKNSAGKAIPIIGPTANIILDSLLEGSTNAFLTLRVGILTKKYCASLERLGPQKARRSAIAEASSLLGSLVIDSSGKVVSALLKASKKAGIDSLKSSLASLKSSAKKMKQRVFKVKGKMSPTSQN